MPELSDTDDVPPGSVVMTPHHARVPEWVLYERRLSVPARWLYSILVDHINHRRGDTDVWPSQELLAHWAGYAKTETITPYVRELECWRLVRTRKTPPGRGRWRARNTYTMRLTPPDDHDGPADRSDAVRRANAALGRNVPSDTDGPAVPPPTGVLGVSARGKVPPPSGVLHTGYDASAGQQVPPPSGVLGSSTPVQRGGTSTKGELPPPPPSPSGEAPQPEGDESPTTPAIPLDPAAREAAERVWRRLRTPRGKVPPSKEESRRIRRLLAQAIAAQWPEDPLTDVLMGQLDNVRSVAAVWITRLSRLDDPPSVPTEDPRGGADRAAAARSPESSAGWAAARETAREIGSRSRSRRDTSA